MGRPICGIVKLKLPSYTVFRWAFKAPREIGGNATMMLTRRLENMLEAYLTGLADVARLRDWVTSHAIAVAQSRDASDGAVDLVDGVLLALEQHRAGSWGEDTLKLVLERELQAYRQPSNAPSAPQFRFFNTCPTLVAPASPMYATANR